MAQHHKGAPPGERGDRLDFEAESVTNPNLIYLNQASFFSQAINLALSWYAVRTIDNPTGAILPDTRTLR